LATGVETAGGGAAAAGLAATGGAGAGALAGAAGATAGAVVVAAFVTGAAVELTVLPGELGVVAAGLETATAGAPRGTDVPPAASAAPCCPGADATIATAARKIAQPMNWAQRKSLARLSPPNSSQIILTVNPNKCQPDYQVFTA
jgi:hypothetical protein